MATVNILLLACFITHTKKLFPYTVRSKGLKPQVIMLLFGLLKKKSTQIFLS